MTPSNGKFSALQGLCARSSPVTGEFPSQRPVARSFDIFFELRLDKRLSKQSWGWWFETPSHSLWHYCNGYFFFFFQKYLDTTYLLYIIPSYLAGVNVIDTCQTQLLFFRSSPYLMFSTQKQSVHRGEIFKTKFLEPQPQDGTWWQLKNH